MPVVLKGTGGGSVSITSGAAATDTTLTVPNTTGTVALTASPTFTGNVTATTITSPSATALTIQSAGTTAVTIDTSQNVGIGTTSPSARLQVTDGNFSQLYLNSTTTVCGVRFGNTGSTNGYIYYDNGANLTFQTNGVERARIDTNGNLMVGNTTSLIGGGGSIQAVGSSTNRGYLSVGRITAATSGVCGSLIAWNATNPIASFDFQSNGANNSGLIQAFTYSAGSAVQGPYVNTGGTSWTTASDENLKDIIEPIENGVEKLSSLRSIIGKFKTDHDDVRRVFLIAQDVQKVLPEAICTDPNGYLGLNYQDLIPVLVKAIQELSAKNDALEARLAALEAK